MLILFFSMIVGDLINRASYILAEAEVTLEDAPKVACHP